MKKICIRNVVLEYFEFIALINTDYCVVSILFIKIVLECVSIDFTIQLFMILFLLIKKNFNDNNAILMRL
jgi:hypothetical protein